MEKFGKVIVKLRIPILVLSILLLIPSAIGYVNTRVNYDILYYLPDEIETMQGQDILMDDFNKGAYAMVVVQDMDAKAANKLIKKVESVEHVAQVISYTGIVGEDVPSEMVPSKFRKYFENDSTDTTLFAIFFNNTTSSDDTMNAITQIRKVTEGHFKRIPYNESMLKYGTDKPDLRNPLEIIDVSDVFKETSFRPFRDSIVRAIKVDDIASKPNSWFNEIVDYAKSIDMPGIGYISVMEDKSLKGPIDKFLTEDDRKALFDKAGLKTGSVLFFIADKRRDVVCKNAGLIRTELGRKLDLMDNNLFEFCFVTDMPMYEISEITGKLDFMHNPFSMPRGGMKALETMDPLDIYADQFDVVCNGVELVSGAVRNNRPEVLLKAFSLAGYTEEDIKKKFSALYTAFKYGCPPHAGMALGIDRSLMMLGEEESVRETVAFPLNQNGEDVLTGTPNEVTEQQLRETHIKLR